MANLNNLVFFSEKGIEIPMQKTYTITWEIIPNTQVANNFISNPKGHFLYDLPTDEDTPPEIQVVIDDPGQIIICPTTIHFTPSYNVNLSTDITISTAKDIILLNKSNTYTKLIAYKKNRFSGELYPETKEEIEHVYNRVKITFNTLSNSIEQYYPINFVFENISVIPQESKDLDNNTTFIYNKISYLALATAGALDEGPYDNIILGLIDVNFVSYDTLFPCIKYMGQYKQDKTSVELIAASTIIIVEPRENQSDPSLFSDIYMRPVFNDDYELYFEFQKNSEMKFISEESIDKLIWKDSHTVQNNNIEFFTDLHDGTDSIIEGDFNNYGQVNQNRPIYFSVGFETDVEGCYQNVLAMYVKYNNGEEEKKYLLGLLTFLTEVEGEDERYRALLGNLGIPDPITYPNIFFEQDPNEEGINWNLINTKSKELMLTYDEIFPYAGTYKSLFGAINFLGYYDLIFKEWYKIKDSNNRTKLVTIQTYDLQKNESLVPKLKQTFVNFGDYERYKKLNRLTMIYHLNEINDTSGEYLDIYYKRKDVAVNNGPTTAPESGLYKTINPFMHFAEYDDEFNVPYNYEAASTYFDLPFTTRIYECRTTELLAKLHSVKLWLEKYILGVNCYISDICGEGIIIERMKTQGYVTEHHLQDFIAEAHITPKIKTISDFVDSSAIVTCTLNEYNTLTFEDYKDIPIENFIRKTLETNGKTIYISNPIGALILADEYEFILENKDTSTCSLVEFTDSSYIDNPILIQDNKLLFFNDYKNITKIAQDELPMIEIIQGNLRYCHGSWDTNIKYSINLGLDQDSGNEYYHLYDNEYDNTIYKGAKKVILYPHVKNENLDFYRLYWVYGEDIEGTDETYSETYNNLDSDFVYTAHTKWNVPMLILRNYICGNTKDMLNGDFILEIIEGNIIFRNHKVKIDDGTCVGCNVQFGLEFDSDRQNILTSFTYMSERIPIFTYDISGLEQRINEEHIAPQEIDEELIGEYLTINKEVYMKVNRIGDYTVSVKAYNPYNNVFFNQSDKSYSVYSTPVLIDKIINTEHMFNEKDFFDKNKTGIKLELIEKQELFNDLSTAYPKAPQVWRLYDIDPVLDSSNEIIYNNISYALDTPNKGDFILFNNFTEKITYIEKTNSTEFKIMLLDENPNKDIIKNSNNIGLCIYDNIQKEIIADICPLTIQEVNILDCSKYNYNINNSFIKITEDDENLYDNSIEDEITLTKLADLCKDSSILDTSSYFINGIQGFIYPADEILLDLTDISVNYNDKRTYITDTKQHFIESQVIKICYTDETELHNHYTKNAIDNETTYRIIDVSLNTDESVVYTLDGLFDIYKLNNKIYHNKAEYSQEQQLLSRLNTLNEYKIKICPAHLRAIQYILRIDDFGEEIVQKYNQGTLQKIKIKYANKPLLFESYLDTIYSAYIINYDPDFLKNIWINPSIIFTKDEDSLYSYKEFPITLDKGRTVILRPDKKQNKLTNTFTTYNIKKNPNTNEPEIQDKQYIIEKSVYDTPFKTVWTWQSFIIDDQENWHGNEDLVGKQTIFKSVNDILPIKVETLGTQTTQMDCIDIYGNLLRNFGEGSIYVKGDGKSIINRAEQETRNIYYKDVYIVGFESFTALTNVISQQGENTTIVNNGTNGNLYGAEKDDSINPLQVNYKIYYNDGTVLENTGAAVHLLTAKGNISKTNKIKMKIGQSKYPHKHVCGKVSGLFKIQKTSPKDLITPEINFETDILQYGYAVTTSIYNMTFNLKDIPKEGYDNLSLDIISNLIKDINYTILRTNGEFELIQGDNLNDVYLKLISYTYIDNLKGNINYISENITDDRREIGILNITVQYDVRGLERTITTTAKTIVYQSN